ncbi:MAG: (Fe-S)-binding protein [Rhodobiaceae bacterium]|nr:(Fe-S)-binding protein [Rhodobiaceae bacterium]MCC0013458.1 (Fe-S)-binding protein [Rhodobiaceae bacterium]MCC0018071.1 (Fe-S)-binding protein [Rhodobiaceae bacterium]MCC0059760.1 (Fe-S)-binding protein [Rhodobiaceae bacterium]
MAKRTRATKSKTQGDDETPIGFKTGDSVALFVTCLVDMFRPSVGFAAVKLVESRGGEVAVPRAQTCCGQPAFNSGDRDTARDIAKQVIAAFERYDHVVVPSGSCGGMIKKHYPELLADDPQWAPRADALSAKTHELVSFLYDVTGMTECHETFEGSVTYHDSCSGLRELAIKRQPRRLLESAGVNIVEMKDSEVCCGFGGTFCVKYPDISNTMVGKKTGNIAATGAGTLLAGDLGCLMNMAGKLRREGIDIEVRHVAEILAGMTDEPPIAGSHEDHDGGL